MIRPLKRIFALTLAVLTLCSALSCSQEIEQDFSGHKRPYKTSGSDISTVQTTSAQITTDKTNTSGTTGQVTPPTVDTTKAKTVICVDAGHGFVDGGAVSPFEDWDGGQILEKDITLDISRFIVENLRAMGYTVVMARGADDEEPAAGLDSSHICNITRRVQWSNAQSHDLYVSIHCNSFDNESVNGVRMYYNKNNNGTKNAALSNELYNTIYAFTDKKPKINNDANLYAVTATKMPAVLIECGFITNRNDVTNMTDPRWQQGFATAVANGIDEFLSANG